MINKMPGFPDDKFANLKAGYTFMMGHPGKKLLFMGQDFGQYHEWNEKTALDWYLAEEPQHRDLLKYYSDLLHIYQKYPALYRPVSYTHLTRSSGGINSERAFKKVVFPAPVPPLTKIL